MFSCRVPAREDRTKVRNEVDVLMAMSPPLTLYIGSISEDPSLGCGCQA